MKQHEHVAESEPITERIAGWARRRPDLPAVTHGERSLGYAELYGSAAALASRLRARGVGRDTLVPLWLDRSPELVVSALAVLLAGGAYVGMDTGEPPARAGAILADCDAPVILTTRALADRLPPGSPPEILVDLAAAHEPTALSAAHEPTELPASDDATGKPGTAGGGDLCYVTFTSGSTGRPKGVLVEHRGVADLVSWYVDTFRVAPGDRMPQIARPSFDGWALEVWPCLAGGATLCIAERRLPDSPDDFVDWLSDQRVSVAFFTTALAVRLLQASWDGRGGSMRVMLLGGEKLHAPPAVHPPFRLFHVYRPTEATMLATCGEIEPGADRAVPPPIGRPLPGLTAHVLDERLRPVAEGEPGELHLSGTAVARGYLNRPEQTARSFRDDPFAGRPGVRMYATGDLVKRLPDGRLAFLGRTDDQVKVRGFRIEPGEIESALLAVPGVARAAVVAPEPEDGETRRLVGYWVAAEADAPPDARTLRDRLAAALPQYMVPHALVRLDSLPLTPHGKTDRRALAARPLPAPSAGRTPPGDASAGEEAAGFGPTERLLAELWGRVLGQRPTSRDDSFFDLGGDSLLAMRLAAEAKRHDLHFGAEDMFETDILGELAELLDERAGRGTAVAAATAPATTTGASR
ncbi:non-ribosomal peptide synthetase [Actinomadura rupiterrae]|uniref:non-ribosomal peptide synthetase n=1 Tax=Actinomadura rupiterrae TaxID=559627 RepID=UPI0020A32E46|nr:non-ribosomal peptide synthetase [Actinomadura rupiterrae]MCP2339298.1 amino acid adenylation domain-containing protein [Actinomadura rupiterrae]